MNCEMGIWVVTADPRAAEEYLTAARKFIQTVEARLSRFRPQSELSRLNTRSGQTVRVSQLLWEVLLCALEAAHHTDGLYDPTVLSALEAAGYLRSFDDHRPQVADGQPPLFRRQRSAVGDPHSRAKRTRRSFWRGIRLDPSTRRVILPPGVRLDLGGIAKGWTAERVADRLAALGPCLVDAGGDIAARGRPPGQAGWPIGVADPQNPEADLTLLLVQDRGVATSGVDYRRWTCGNTVQHHIIDPRTYEPARTDLLSVTVVAPDAIQADLHALVALLLGARTGYRYLVRRRATEGLLVCDDGRQFVTPGFRQYVFS